MSGDFWEAELETKPWGEVQAWQAERLSQFIDDLGLRSDFYRQRLKGLRPKMVIRSLEALSELPFTTKEDLRRSQENLTPERPFGTNQAVPIRDVVQTVSSSGTTGRPVYYALTRLDQEMWSDCIANMFFTAGIRADDVIAHLTRLPMVAGGLSYADGLRRIGATLVWLGGLPTEQILRTLSALHVTAITATVSFEIYLIDRCSELIGRELPELGLQKLVGGGEPGLGQPEIRNKIKRGWGLSHVREAMGLSDVMAGIWSECEDESGMHFNAQKYVIAELVKPDTGEPVKWAEGAIGEAVYTTLNREATPVLRFRSGDILLVTGMGCPCGRTSPKVRCLGRADDMLIYRGMNVFPTAIRDVILRGFSDIVEPHLRLWKEHPLQVRFDSPIPLEVEARDRIEPARRDIIQQQIAEAIRNELQVRVDVTLVPPGTIPRTEYKTPLVYVRPQPEGRSREGE